MLPPPPPRLRLLVADDNPQWQNAIVGILQADHDLVGVVERGDQVIEAAQRLCPDVITLDVSMPGMSGLIALPRLRAAFPKTIIIIVSATATDLYRDEAFIRGADGYVDKSRALSDLINAIASARHRDCQRMTEPGADILGRFCAT